MTESKWLKPISGVLVLAFGILLYLVALAASWLIYRFGEWSDPPYTPTWIIACVYISYTLAAVGLLWTIVTAVIQHQRK